MSMYETKIVKWPLPGNIKAFTRQVDFENIIVVNENLDESVQYRSIRHEVEHIRQDDFSSDQNVEEIERCLKEGLYGRSRP